MSNTPIRLPRVSLGGKDSLIGGRLHSCSVIFIPEFRCKLITVKKNIPITYSLHRGIELTRNSTIFSGWSKWQNAVGTAWNSPAAVPARPNSGRPRLRTLQAWINSGLRCRGRPSPRSLTHAEGLPSAGMQAKRYGSGQGETGLERKVRGGGETVRSARRYSSLFTERRETILARPGRGRPWRKRTVLTEDELRFPHRLSRDGSSASSGVRSCPGCPGAALRGPSTRCRTAGGGPPPVWNLNSL